MKLPKTPPSLKGLLHDTDRLPELVRCGIAKIPPDRYLHWDELRRKPPPEGFTVEEWWLAKKLSRSPKHLSVHDKNGEEFGVVIADSIQEMLHRVDSHARGSLWGTKEVSPALTNAQSRDRYLVSSLFEESITSSQLEGAATTYKVAKQMLRAGRKPTDRSERMILNNYRAMVFVREIADQPLTPAAILELHEIVTQNTLDSATAVGRFRTSDDDVKVIDGRDNTILHEPPEAGELPERIKLLCQFANGHIPKDGFLHPVVRAIVIHFLIGYDHPFVDGNGRTARALFYWSMVRSEYWLAEFISISTILRKAPSQYARAYLLTESDDQDVTYFVDYNLRTILRAIDALHVYLRKKTGEMQDVEQLLGSSEVRYLLNHRQIAVVANALKKPGNFYTIQSHMKSHDIAYQTARTDLLRLAELNLLDQRKRGKTFTFHGKPDIRDSLKGISV